MIDRTDTTRSGAFGVTIPPSPASAEAQGINQGGPLNIRHIRRGYEFVSVTGRASNISVSTTTWREVDQALAFTIATSERPLIIEARATCNVSSGSLYLNLMVDGVPVTSATSGLAVVGSTATSMAPMWSLTPGTGSHRVSLAARVTTSTSGTIYCVNDVAVLTAREV